VVRTGAAPFTLATVDGGERSYWHRWADEWGTGFRFDEPGCWHIDLHRGVVHARVPIRVVD
jgi:hypothetical protein